MLSSKRTLPSFSPRAALACAALAALSGVSTSALAGDEPVAPLLTQCSAPVASIMVGGLQCKASNCGNGGAGAGGGGIAALMGALAGAGQAPVTGIGDGIKDMLTTALQETGCFEVMERDAMNEIEQELARAGKKVQTRQADFLVSGSVTQIDVERSSTGFGGGLLPIIGSVGVNTQKASVAMDVRLISVDTARVVGSRKLTANSEKSSFGVGGLGGMPMGGSLVGFAGGFSSLKGTNLEAVTRDAVIQAANFLVEQAKTAKPR